MRPILRTLGCAVVSLSAVIGFAAVIFISSSGGLTVVQRLIWVPIGIAAFAVSGAVFWRMRRSGEAWKAQRSERPGPTFGTRERSYASDSFEDAVSLFERDARSLAALGYRATDTAWEPMAHRHPLWAGLLTVLELAASARYLWLTWVDLGSRGGTLGVVYQLASTSPEALASLDTALHRLRNPQIKELEPPPNATRRDG